MSCDFERGLHSPCEVRGHFSRRALPCLCLSTLDEAISDCILVLPCFEVSNTRGLTRLLLFLSRISCSAPLTNPLDRAKRARTHKTNAASASTPTQLNLARAKRARAPPGLLRSSKICLLIGNDGSFKTLYLLSRQRMRGRRVRSMLRALA